MKRTWKIGTRASQLALVQANLVKQGLEQKFPELQIELVHIKTSGDIHFQNLKLGKGLFLKEIEQQLLNQQVDFGVHSMKDVPYNLPLGLKIGAILKRENPHDAFVSLKYPSFFDLPPQATVGSGSLRRKIQLMQSRPDLKWQDLRGNVDSRLKALQQGRFDAIILAAAGLIRLNKMNLLRQFLPANLCLPAAGQGAIGVEIRTADAAAAALIQHLNDVKTNCALQAERALLRTLKADCHQPVAAYAEAKLSTAIKPPTETKLGALSLQAWVGSTDGQQVFSGHCTGEDAEQTGVELAQQLLEQGAGLALNHD